MAKMSVPFGVKNKMLYLLLTALAILAALLLATVAVAAAIKLGEWRLR